MSGNVRKNINKKAPKIGELINPIVLVKKETTPDVTNPAAWDRKLKPYRSAMAKIVERNRETSDPEIDFQEDNTHEFIFRTYTGESIERNADFVLHDAYIYDIQYVTRVVDGIPYVKLVCTKDSPIEDYDYEQEVIEAPTTDPDDQVQFPGFGEW